VSGFPFEPIGVIHSPYRTAEEAPIQPVYATGTEGTAEIDPRFAPGLRDLEGFSHIHLLYCFHRRKESRLLVRPFLDDVERGVFATRSPCRPNPIGLSLVRLLAVEGNILRLADLDVLDGTPLLDIKPYFPDFDARRDVRCGWYEAVDPDVRRTRGRRSGPHGGTGRSPGDR